MNVGRSVAIFNPRPRTSRREGPKEIRSTNIRTACIVLALLGISACGRPVGEGDPSAREGIDTVPVAGGIESVRFVRVADTIAVVGGVGENNPHFQWRMYPSPRLVDERTVAYAEPGRLVVADLISGEGWEVASPSGAAGPGEFDGRQPNVYPSGDTVYTFAWPTTYNVWTPAGDLLASERYSPPPMGGETWMPAGFAGGRLVAWYVEEHPRVDGEYLLRRGFRIYDASGTVVADISEGIPEMLMSVSHRGASLNGSQIGGGTLIVAARGETIVEALMEEGRIRSFDLDGELLADREMDSEIRDLCVDADGRVWARTDVRDTERTTVHIVMDRTLTELFRVSARNFRDASGRSMLVAEVGELGTVEWILLQIDGL